MWIITYYYTSEYIHYNIIYNQLDYERVTVTIKLTVTVEVKVLVSVSVALILKVTANVEVI